MKLQQNEERLFLNYFNLHISYTFEQIDFIFHLKILLKIFITKLRGTDLIFSEILRLCNLTHHNRKTAEIVSLRFSKFFRITNFSEVKHSWLCFD